MTIVSLNIEQWNAGFRRWDTNHEFQFVCFENLQMLMFSFVFHSFARATATGSVVANEWAMWVSTNVWSQTYANLDKSHGTEMVMSNMMCIRTLWCVLHWMNILLDNVNVNILYGDPVVVKVRLCAWYAADMGSELQVGRPVRFEHEWVE